MLSIGGRTGHNSSRLVKMRLSFVMKEEHPVFAAPKGATHQPRVFCDRELPWRIAGHGAAPPDVSNSVSGQRLKI